ncbi:MAG: 2-oxo acid dehydrogenase subunit E2 [Kiritimatiellae bacterium]|nr:2-oxo acid dehydrogenase subunit E2 [Kiritimatiellia bacterium]
MSEVFAIPPLGENVESGDLVKVLVNPGDAVSAGQPLLEIETGKATVEVPAPRAGRIGRLLVSPGTKVTVGQPVFEWAGEGGDAVQSPVVPTEPREAPSRAEGVAETTFPLPALGENVERGTIVKLLAEAGAEVREGQPLLEIETGKATVEVPSPRAGRIAEWLVRAGETVVVGGAVLRWATGDGAPTVRPAPSAAPPPAPAPPARAAVAAPEPAVEPPPAAARAGVPVPAAPSVRRFAREIGVDISAVKGSGAGGRITIEDVKRHARQINTGRAVRTHCALEAEPLPDFTRWGPVERESMSTIRTITAEHLSRAWATIPHVTQHDKADITELEALRKRFAPRAEAAGGRLTLTAILLKIVAAALKVHPKFNASVDMPGRAIIYKKYVHIGVAVDTPRGLLVPVVRDVDRKNIIQISIELTSLAQRAREGKLSPDELQGGTFTVTNLGAIGGSFFTPIINAPEVAILGVGRSAMENVWSGPESVCRPRMMLPLSLSYDHRLIDGADGARFMRWIVEAIEEPMLISLEG